MPAGKGGCLGGGSLQETLAVTTAVVQYQVQLHTLLPHKVRDPQSSD